VSYLDFPRTQRLLNSRDFSVVFNNANIKIHMPYFLVLAIHNNQPFPRLGCVVARKHAKCAVERNRIKRLVRETFRLNKKTLQACDIVIIAKSGTSKQHNQTLFHELGLLWKKPSLIKSE
jgi:ribonuclease P protein component